VSPMQRRDFLALALGGAFAPTVLRLLRPGSPGPKRLLQLNAYALDAETPLDLLGDYLTPNELFFVRSHWPPRMPDPAAWRLVIDGEVANPLSLSLAELKRLPRASATCVLQCAGNGRSLQSPAVPGVQWGSGAVGNARWTGVKLRDLLARAGLKPSARHLHTEGSDAPPGKVPAFRRSIELDKAVDDVIVAYEMNGAPLPPLHGAPARLVVPGWAGDHWMKWLTRLSAQPEPQTGFYMDMAYRYPKTPGAPGVAFKPEDMNPVTELLVKATITSAPIMAKPGSTAVLRGFAFSGAPDIARVELSDDDGATWRSAVLDSSHQPHSWRLWRYEWKAARPGSAKLVVRATDSRGAVQPRLPVWNQSGYLSNGWDSATIDVSERATSASNGPAGPTAEPGSKPPALPEGEGKAIADRACQLCHSGDVLRQQRLTERQWTASITKMKGWGAEVSDSEAPRLIAYLQEHFGSGNESYRPLIVRPVRK